MPLKKSKRSIPKTNKTRSNGNRARNNSGNNSDRGYITATGENNSGNNSDTGYVTADGEPVSNHVIHNSGFQATVYALNPVKHVPVLPIPANCTLFVRDIGYVPVKREYVNEKSYIDSPHLKGLGQSFEDSQLTFSLIDHNKFVVRVTDSAGHHMGHAVGALHYSFNPIPSTPYLSSKNLHRESLNHANPGRRRQTTETSMPAGTREIKVGDPFIDLKLFGVNQNHKRKASGFTGYHLIAICILLLNEFHLPALPYYTWRSRGTRPLNGLAYPIYVLSVPGAVKFYEANGFLKVPLTMVTNFDGKLVEGYIHPFTGNSINAKGGTPLVLPA